MPSNREQANQDWIDRLLQPISADAPAGIDLRNEAADLTFVQLQEERTEVPPEDDPNGRGHEPNWQKIVTRCESVLEESSKDLQIAAWLTEALARTRGFGGLEDGLSLVLALLEQHWEALHPGVDADEQDGIDHLIRARPLGWLGSSKAFLAAAASCPLADTVPADASLCWDDMLKARLVDDSAGKKDKHEELQALGFVDSETFNARASAAPIPELSATHSTVVRCEDTVRRLKQLVEERFESGTSPNLVPLGELLLDIREYLEPRVATLEEIDAVSLAESDPISANGPASSNNGSSSPPASRDQAIHKLTEVAEYFRRTEPHSPIAYLVARAVRWARMPLIEVLGEFVEDPNALARIRHNLGITEESTTPNDPPSKTE